MHNLSSAYTLLLVAASVEGIVVFDTERDGPGVTLWLKKPPSNNEKRFVIVVGHYKSLKKRLFVLAHELGHCTMFKRNKNGEGYLKLRKNPCGELEANKTAVRILNELDPRYPKQFADFYNHANRESSRRKPFKLPKNFGAVR